MNFEFVLCLGINTPVSMETVIVNALWNKILIWQHNADFLVELCKHWEKGQKRRSKGILRMTRKKQKHILKIHQEFLDKESKGKCQKNTNTTVHQQQRIIHFMVQRNIIVCFQFLDTTTGMILDVSFCNMVVTLA